jgi:hypothetical protein
MDRVPSHNDSGILTSYICTYLPTLRAIISKSLSKRRFASFTTSRFRLITLISATKCQRMFSRWFVINLLIPSNQTVPRFNLDQPVSVNSFRSPNHRNLSTRRGTLKKVWFFQLVWSNLFCVVKRGFVDHCKRCSFVVYYLVWGGDQQTFYKFFAKNVCWTSANIFDLLR